MAYALQCCVRCGNLEHGHTGPADRYLCGTCHRAGFRVDLGGTIHQVAPYLVHTWDPGRGEWHPEAPPIEAILPRLAYLSAKQRHPGQIVHVARVLVQPCSPGGRAHA